MSPPATIDRAQIAGWASRQLADYDACNPGTLFAERPVLDISQAYALQSGVAELRRRRGERIIGYKVGCTSRTIRAQLGIDHCVSGRLYDSEQHLSGAVLSRTRYAHLAIEGELAVELSREPTADDFSGDGVPACVARVFPVIELHNHVLRSEQPSVGELIANNAIHAGFVAGCGVSPEEALAQPSLAIFADDCLLEKCVGCSLIQTMRSSLQWLREIVRDRGDQLCAGQIVLTGSILGLIPIQEDCHIRIDTSPFGLVEATFIQ